MVEEIQQSSQKSKKKVKKTKDQLFIDKLIRQRAKIQGEYLNTRPFKFEVYGKVFEMIKGLETAPNSCMYNLSSQTIRDIIKLVIKEVK